MQMTQVCSTAWNTIMTYSWKLDHMVTFSQRCFFKRTRTLSPLSKDGHFLAKFTSMVMSACCPHPIHTHICLILPLKAYLPYQHWFLHWFSCWYLSGDELLGLKKCYGKFWSLSYFDTDKREKWYNNSIFFWKSQTWLMEMELYSMINELVNREIKFDSQKQWNLFVFWFLILQCDIKSSSMFLLTK